MTKGYQAHQERLAMVNGYGRDLARRSKSKCELCGASGVSLHIVEVTPIPLEPELAHCIFVCDTCQGQLANPKRLDANHWRCLHDSVWSDVVAVQVTAVLLLRLLSPTQPWATDLLDQLYLAPEVEEWLNNPKTMLI